MRTDADTQAKLRKLLSGKQLQNNSLAQQINSRLAKGQSGKGQ